MYAKQHNQIIMNLSVWNAVNDYYRALWTHFSLERLAEALDDNVVAKHTHYGDHEVAVKELVLQQYKATFFDTCDIASTRVFDFHMHPHSEDSVRVSYTISQRHNDARGVRISGYSELLEVSPLTGKIIYVEMTPTSRTGISERK